MVSVTVYVTSSSWGFAASRLSMSDPSVSKLDYDPVKNWTLGFAEATKKN